MASLSEEDLSCSICRDIFRDPVVVSCSHSFCQDCLKNWWELKGVHECPICKKRSSKKKKPQVSLVLKNLCEAFVLERNQRASEDVCVNSEKLFCLEHQLPVCVVGRDTNIQNNDRFIPVDEAAKHRREELQTYLKPLREKLKVFERVQMHCNQTEEHIKVQARNTERQIQEQFKKLHQFLQEEEDHRIFSLKAEEECKRQRVKEEIETLNREIAALSDTIRVTEDELRADDVSFLQNYKAAVNRVQQRPLLEDPRQVSGALIDEAKHLGNLSFNIWNKMKEVVEYTPVILDPNTAHPDLSVSEDLTSVSHENRCFQTLPDNPERFDVGKFVLGSEGWDSGSHSWVVEVGSSNCWSVGVAAESFRRRGSNDLTSGLWALTCRGQADGNKYQIISTLNPPAFIPVQGTLRQVRVDLDLDKGRLLFSDSDTDTQIHTLTHTFTEKMYPVLMCGDAFLVILSESSHENGGIDLNEIRKKFLQYSKR